MTRTELVKSLEADLGKQLGSNYGYDWCAAYVSDKLLKPIGEKWFSSCTQMRDYFNQKGRVNHDYRTAEIGDIIEFDWDLSGDCDHVGIIVDVDYTKGVITTIEGNTDGNHWKLSKVAKHTYSMDYRYFANIIDMSSVFMNEAQENKPAGGEQTDTVLKAVKLIIDGEVVYDGYVRIKK